MESARRDGGPEQVSLVPSRAVKSVEYRLCGLCMSSDACTALHAWISALAIGFPLTRIADCGPHAPPQSSNHTRVVFALLPSPLVIQLASLNLRFGESLLLPPLRSFYPLLLVDANVLERHLWSKKLRWCQCGDRGRSSGPSPPRRISANALSAPHRVLTIPLSLLLPLPKTTRRLASPPRRRKSAKRPKPKRSLSTSALPLLPRNGSPLRSRRNGRRTLMR